MSRYLTPAKIGLLVLIQLYAESVVSIASTVDVLSFIVSHLLPTNPTNAHSSDGTTVSGGKSAPFLISVQEFRDVLGAHQSASGVPGRTLWDAFLQRLWEINSLDALHEFFEQKSELVAKSKEELQVLAEAGHPPPDPSDVLLSATSPFGTFVRRSQLEFSRLRFHDAANLWKGFIAYRQPTLPTWQKRNPNADSWSFDVVLHDAHVLDAPESARGVAVVAYRDVLQGKGGIEEQVSTDDVEKLLEFQIEQMQKLGNRIPDTVRNQFEGVLASNLKIPSLSHYVNFLDAWRARDYPTSFDNLHRFFDYTMQNRDRLFYQYALLNLAVLQADFGCYQEAVAAMQETVTTARENKDMGCLNFSLSWLYHFGKAHPNEITASEKTNMLGVEREGLVFLRMKAKETGMWSLWSSSLLSEAKLGLSNGESVATAFQNIVRSSQLSITKNMMSNVGAQMMLQSSLWGRLGDAHLSWSYCEIFLQCHSRLAPFDDILKFTCRIAYMLTQKGSYDEAMERMESLDANSLRSLKPHQYWLRFRGILRLKRELRRGNLDGSTHILSQLSQNKTGDPELTFELDALTIETMVRKQDYDAAFEKIEALATSMKDHGEDIFFRIRLLIIKAELLDKCGRPQRGFSIAVKAAMAAWRARILPLLWQAMGAIANILNYLGEYEASSQILASVIPRALECEDCGSTAQLYSYLVDAHVGWAGKSEAESVQRREHLTKAVDCINWAFAEYSSIEDIEGQCEMMAKKATLMKLLGDQQLANDYAAAYLDLRKNAAAPVE